MTQAQPASDKPLQSLRDYLMLRKTQIEARIDKGMSADRLIRIAHTAATKTPKLALCPPESIYMALLAAGQLGVEPNTSLKHGYLVPRWNAKTRQNEAVFQVGYQGLIYSAIRSGSVRAVWAEVVCENDRFEAPRGHNPDIVHHVNLKDPGEIIAAYAVAVMPDGTKKDALMSRAQIEKNRDSGGGQDGPSAIWRDHFGEMAKKTAIIRLMKTVGMGPSLAAALEAEEGEVSDGADEGGVLAEGETVVEGASKPTARGGAVAQRARGALAGHGPAQLPEPSALREVQTAAASAAPEAVSEGR